MTENILKLSLDFSIVIHNVVSVNQININGDLLINELAAFYLDVITNNIFVHECDWIELTGKL